MSQRPFNLLVFDWDGTVMDSESQIVNCLQAAIKDLGLPERTDDEAKNIIGLGLREAVETLYPGSSDQVHRDLVESYRHHWLAEDAPQSSLFPGAKALLESLNDAGYLLAVATGKGRRGLNKVLDETGLGGMFVTSRCADEAFSKPHPQMLEYIMDFTGCEPAETLMIGDTVYDMEMANNASTHALAVTYGVHELERLQQHNPIGVIDNLIELQPWLQSRL
ncbi:MAG: HAD-IA family hydrolase [Gammaproteobacteria bacterium]|nr:HAD-IA family hydrolase [Gammaproteobacteria bacterium]MCW8983339.1 HAD-IA family hydrolase [Gammaproteobacteria bacterium]